MPIEVNRYPSGGSSGTLQAYVIAPPQYLGNRKVLAPEQRLMIAVVQEAMNCVEKYRCATDYRGRRLFGEVMHWFGAEETDWPYSFESICGVLGLDADAVRQRLGVARATPGVCSVQDDLRIAAD